MNDLLVVPDISMHAKGLRSNTIEIKAFYVSFLISKDKFCYIDIIWYYACNFV